jgi:GH24 family phage-related lysozyme (muramidase)
MPANMTPEEMEASLTEALRLQEEDIRQYGEVTQDTKNKLVNAKNGIKTYADELKRSINALKTSAAKTVGSMAESAKGTGQYTEVLKAGADAANTYLSSRGPIGQASGELLKLATDYVVAVGKQADDLYKSYQTVSRAGSIGEGGITELYSTMQKFGYGIEELGDLEKILQANSTSLAALSGTAFDGAQTLGNLSKNIRESDIGVAFQNMGLTVDGMNAGIASYLRLEQRLGTGQLKTQEELQSGAQEYLYQQEKLTKITGLSADKQSEAREAALSEQRFGAHIADLKFKAADAESRGDLESAAKLRAQAERDQRINLNLKAAGNEEMAANFRNVTAGYLNDKGALKFQNALPDAIKEIRNGASEADVMNAISRDAKKISQDTVELQKAGKASEIYGNMAEYRRVSNLEDFNKRVARATESMDVTDPATGSMTKLGIKQRQTRDDLQNLKQIGIRPVTAGFEALAKAMSVIPGVASKVATTVTGGGGGTTGAQQRAPAGTQAAPKVAPAAAAPAPVSKAAPATAAPAPAPAPAPKVAPSAPAPTPSAPAPSTPVSAAPAPVEEAKAKLTEKVTSTTAATGAAMTAGLDAIKQMIIKHEGLRNKPYKDSLGLWTVGVGHLIGDGKTLPEAMNREFSQQEIMAMFEEDFTKHYAIAQRTPGWDKANDIGKGAMIDLAFNMGQWWNKFPNTAKALAAGDWKGASAGLRDSKWFSQVKGRAVTVTGMIEQAGGGSKTPSAANGGILSGPAGGYAATLHGNEAVVPLPGKQSGIPVQTSGFDSLISSRVGMFTEQLQKFDSLMLAMQKHVDISNKILQRAS